MPTYKRVENPGMPVIIHRENDDGTVSQIPTHPDNRDYQEYLKHEAAQKEAAEKTPKTKRRTKP